METQSSESTPRSRPGGTLFLLVFGLVAMVIAGGLSYLADEHPDGLDAVTRHGCQTVETSQGEELHGRCIAQEAGDHVFSGGPFADYALQGDARFTGVAGVIGVVATLTLSLVLFLLLARRRSSRDAEGP